MKPITELIAQASTLIREISDHPDYKALIDKGYSPELGLIEAQIVFVCLSEEIVKDLKLRMLADEPSDNAFLHHHRFDIVHNCALQAGKRSPNVPKNRGAVWEMI